MTYLFVLFQAGTVVSLNSVLALQINDDLMDSFPFPFPGSELTPTVGVGLRQSKDLRSTPELAPSGSGSWKSLRHTHLRRILRKVSYPWSFPTSRQGSGKRTCMHSGLTDPSHAEKSTECATSTAEVRSEPRSRKVSKFKAEVDVMCRLNPAISFSVEYHFFDSTGGGAWPLLLVDRVSLVNSFNERDLSLPNSVRGILCVLHKEV